MNLAFLKKQRAAAAEAAQAIFSKAETENRSLTAEELAAFDAKETEVKNLDEQIARGERALALGNTGTTPAPRGPVTVHDNREDQPFHSLGEQLVAVMNSERRKEVDPRLRQLQERAILGASESVPADGGFFVQKDMSNTILQRVYDVGGLINRCRRYPVGANANGVKLPGVDESSRADGSRIGGLRGYWVDEGATITSSKPKFYMVELTLNKVAAAVYLTDELVSDAALLESFVLDRVPEELRFKVEDAIINGDGSGKPLGILNAPCTVSVAKEAGQAATTFVYENLKKMWSRMWAPSRANAVWFINQDVEPELYGMGLTIGTGGSPVYLPPGGASVAPYGTLFGRPVVPLEYCPTLGSVGDVVLADMSQYYLIDKGGIQSASSIHVQFLTDQSVLRFVYRVDGEPVWKDPLTPFKGTSNTRSPFVTLAVRS